MYFDHVFLIILLSSSHSPKPFIPNKTVSCFHVLYVCMHGPLHLFRVACRDIGGDCQLNCKSNLVGTPLRNMTPPLLAIMNGL